MHHNLDQLARAIRKAAHNIKPTSKIARKFLRRQTLTAIKQRLTAEPRLPRHILRVPEIKHHYTQLTKGPGK